MPWERRQIATSPSAVPRSCPLFASPEPKTFRRKERVRCALALTSQRNPVRCPDVNVGASPCGPPCDVGRPYAEPPGFEKCQPSLSGTRKYGLIRGNESAAPQKDNRLDAGRRASPGGRPGVLMRTDAATSGIARSTASPTPASRCRSHRETAATRSTWCRPVVSFWQSPRCLRTRLRPAPLRSDSEAILDAETASGGCKASLSPSETTPAVSAR